MTEIVIQDKPHALFDTGIYNDYLRENKPEKMNIDIETYSDIDIKLGVYRYCDTPNFEVLIFAFSLDDGPVEVWDLTKNKLPQYIVNLILDDSVMKKAYNAQFERVALSKHLGLEERLNPEAWQCTMVHAMELGLPVSLARCAGYLDIEEQKDTAGTNLINYFSKPCKPTKRNDMRTRNLPEHDTEKWDAFMMYCGQDVVVEMAIADKLSPLPVPDSEWDLYYQDQRMHDTGVAIDLEMANQAIAIDDTLRSRTLGELKALTGLDNPNSPAQLKKWFNDNNFPVDSLGKNLLQGYLDADIVKGDIKKAIELRLQLANSSTKKYVMMRDATCSDGRMRGILQFYGATRTGRYAGRLIQVQNLPRNYMSSLDSARGLVKAGELEGLDLIYDDVPDVLKQLIRTGVVAKEGHELLISDFSAIEARVIAWYANEKWVLQAFRDHGKIYEATADQMFNLGGVDKVTPEMRQRGKVATLALGYQGGVGSLISMGALDQGIKEEELQPLVDSWRKANKNIVNFWYDTQRRVTASLERGGVVKGPKGLKFYRKAGFLFIQLPSGRCLSYARPKIEEGKYGPKITYEGQGSKVYFEKQDTYGGKLVENIVQATARDILAEALLRLEKEGFKIVFHVHDEAVAEMPEGERTIEEMNELMAVNPEWAKGLPLGAEGFKTKYYMKD